MSQWTRDDDIGLLGILIPDERVTAANLVAIGADPEDSDYSQSGVHPGVAEYDRDAVAETSTTAGDLGPSMALETLGEQEESTYQVRVLHAGFPGAGCEVAFRPGIDDDTDLWRGWQTPCVIEYVHGANTVDRGIAPSTGARNFACCATAAHDVLFVVANTGIVRCRLYDPATRTMSSYITIADHAAIPGDDDSAYSFSADDLLVEALLLPTGRLLVYVLTAAIEQTATSDRTVWVFYSDDDGLTWRSGSYLAINPLIDIDYEVVKMRAGYSRESVLLLLQVEWEDEQQTVHEGLLQYASDDMGYTFTLVEDWGDGGTERARGADIVVDEATGILTVICKDTVGVEILGRRIASPFVPLRSVVATTIASGSFIDEVVTWADRDGIQYLTIGPGLGTITMYRSFDGGATWAELTTSPIYLGHATHIIDSWDVCACMGRAVWMIGDSHSDISDHDMMVIETGGWTTLTHPRVPSASMPTETRGWGGADGLSWICHEAPGGFGWTSAGTGTGTLSGTPPYGLGIATAADTRYYHRAGSRSPLDGIIVQWDCSLSTTGTFTAAWVGLQVELGNSTDDMRVELRFASNGVRVYDLNAAATVGDATLDTTELRTYKLAMRSYGSAANGRFTLYSRAIDSDEWEALVTSTTMTVRSAGAGTARVAWGHLIAATETSRWVSVHYTFESGKGGVNRFYDDLAANLLPHAPDILTGGRLPAAPYRLWLKEGLYLRGVSGPGVRGDTWQIPPAYDYPVEVIHPEVSPSPARRWRSQDESEQFFAWELSSGYETHPGNPSWGIAVMGVNFRRAKLQGWDGANWQEVVELFTHQGMVGLDYTRQGDTVRVALVSSPPPTEGPVWVAADELAGCTFDLGDGFFRRITHNTEGAWTLLGKNPMLTLEGIDGTEPTSGTGEIWYTQATALLHEETAHYTRWGLRIPTQGSVDGWFEVGAIIIGPLEVFATKYSATRVIETAPLADLVTHPTGQRTAKLLGPTRRSVSAAWVEGFDSSRLWADPPDPPHVAASSGGIALAARGDSTLLEGIVSRVGGPTRPVVYLPRLVVEESDDVYVSRVAGQERMLYCRLTDVVTRETVVGHEHSTEVVRMTGLRAEQEL